MKLRFRTDDVMLWLLLLMQLGFHTNTGYDDILSLGITVIVFAYFLLSKQKISLFRFTNNARKYIIWYTLVVFWCSISFLWSEQSNLSMIKQLIINTYIPVILSAYSINEYIRRGNDGLRLLTALVVAEIFVTIRALIHTPMGELISKFDTRLYGTGLGVNYNHFTTQFALVFCVVLFLAYVFSKSYYIPALFIFANIIISGSRKVLLVSALAFIILYLVSAGRGSITKRLKRVFVLLLISGFAMWIIMSNEFLYKLIGEKTLVVVSEMLNIDFGVKSDASTDQRKELIVIAGDVFKTHWFNGVGYYSFMNYNKWNVYAHNNYMELLADLGIVGFCAYYWFYLNNLFGYFRKKTPKTDFFKLRLSTDFMKSKWNFLGVIFFLTLMLMEWGQVTYFRLYVLIPLLVITMAIEDMKRRESVKGVKHNVSYGQRA